MPTSAPGSPRAETAQDAIPYRKQNDSLAVDAGGALLAAGLMLALVVVALRYAHRRGLLDRWVVAAPKRSGERPRMRVESAARISPKTMLYRVRDGDRHYLLVESIAQTQLIPIDDDRPLVQSAATDDGAD